MTNVPSTFVSFKYPRYVPEVKPASEGAFPAITISLPVVFDKVIELSEFKTAVTPEASWLISVTRLLILVWMLITLLLIVNVLDIVKFVSAAELTLLNAVASAPWLFEFALIAVAKAAAVLFPEVKFEDNVEAKAFSPFILILFAARFELL